MTSSCYVKAFNEVDFENKQIPIKLEGNNRVLSIFYHACRVKLFKVNLNDFLLYLYTKLGELNARYFASSQVKKPSILKIFEKFINV
jgi:hypothetical protein